jgi:DNA processing protein
LNASISNWQHLRLLKRSIKKRRQSAMNDLCYWIGFNRVMGIGPAKLRALLDHFGDLETAWRANSSDLREAGLDRRALEYLLAARSAMDLNAEVARVKRLGARALTWNDADYPPQLKSIAASPPLLYVKGAFTPADQWAIAVVGTRRATAYGREVTRSLVGDLARSSVTIVSGLARGIDATAHQAALDAGGRTIAVLGHGIDFIYPPEHRKLAEQIAEHGALVTDYPVGTPPEGSNFPPRNRIISGLSLGVLVVEGASPSGARITADFAMEQGHDVFAVPGNILNRSSELPNTLIQEGAIPVLRASDILEPLNLTMVTQHAEAREVIPADATEAELLELLSAEPVHIDDLQRETGLPIAQVSSTLALMELKGMVRQVGGMNYVAARESRATYKID